VTGLLRAEIRRLTSRRLARFAGVGLLAIMLITQVVAAAHSNRDVEGAHRRAEKQAAAENDPVLQRAACERAQARGELPPEVSCAEFSFSGGSSDPDDYYVDPRLSGKEWIPAASRAVTVGAAVLAFIVGASFIGAEWHAGTMQALLFWEPRRGRVLLAKVLALVTVVVAYTAVMQAVVWALSMLVVSTRGSTEGLTSGLQQATFLAMLRGFFVAAATSLLAFSIAGIARVTAAALGVAFGYFVILENVIRGLRPGWQRFLFTENIAAVVQKRIEVFPASAKTSSYLEQRDMFWLTGSRGAVTLCVYLGLLLLVFYVMFHRRDVT
jgi:ABC-type transport system involved in multi-copper enzyme maturation permease subunit